MIDILTNLIDKLLWVAFVFSILGLLRVIYNFLVNFFKNPPQQFKLSRHELIDLGIYVAIIIMSIFTGIRL